MMKRAINKIKPQSGQGMTEYILIVALVAVLGITVFTLFGKQLRAMVGYGVDQMAGNSDAKMQDFSGEDKKIDTGIDNMK